MGKKSTRASPYSSSWNDYRKRVLIFYFSWLVFPLFVSVLDHIPVAHYWISRAGEYLWIFYFLLFLASGLRIILWGCPRCHKHFFIGKVLESRRQPAVVGGDAIVGAVGQVREDLAPEGLVFVKGALWKATAPSPIQAGSTVRVVSRKGLELQVTPENGQTAPKEGA